MSLDKLSQLKDKVAKLRSKAERAKGAADQVRSTLRDEWECSSLGDGRKKLAALEEKVAATRATLDKAVTKFEGDWADELAAAS